MIAVARSIRDVDRARALHRAIRQIFESRPLHQDARALEEVQGLCAMSIATLDDADCRDVMRAVTACADCLFGADGTGSGDGTSIQALISSLLAVFESRLRDLESRRRPADGESDARTGHRRGAQRRDYLTRPATVGNRRIPGGVKNPWHPPSPMR